MKKWILRISIALVLLAATAAAVLVAYIDRLAASTLTASVQSAGDAPCQVSDVSVSLWSGTINVSGLVIRNPRGFPDGQMFDVQKVNLEIELSSLWDNTLHIKRLEIVNPVVHLEMASGGDNIRAFLDNARRKWEACGGPQQKQTRMRIDRLSLEGAQVALGSGDKRFSLGPVTLENVGATGDGVTSGELAAQLLELSRDRAMEQIKFTSLLPTELATGVDALVQTAGVVVNSTAQLLTAPLSPQPTTRPAGSPPQVRSVGSLFIAPRRDDESGR